jgi:Tfp pilus assembly protein PilW
MNCGTFKHCRLLRGAFTVVELMISTGLGIVLLTTLMTTFVTFERSFNSVGEYADLDRQSRNTLDVMTRDIRQAAALTNSTTNGLWFTNVDGTALIYTYNPSSGVFSYTNGSTGQSAVLLSNCTSFTFSLFQNQPTNGTMTFYPATQAKSTKGIIINFFCARTNYLSLKDTESVEAATIVMRN